MLKEFFAHTCIFSITFSSLLRDNVYIILCCLWKIKVFSFQNWQNCIEKFESGRTQPIWKWRIWNLWKNIFFLFWTFFSLFFIFLFSFFCNSKVMLLSKKVLSENVDFDRLLDGKRPKAFFHIIPGYNLS